MSERLRPRQHSHMAKGAKSAHLHGPVVGGARRSTLAARLAEMRLKSRSLGPPASRLVSPAARARPKLRLGPRSMRAVGSAGCCLPVAVGSGRDTRGQRLSAWAQRGAGLLCAGSTVYLPCLFRVLPLRALCVPRRGSRWASVAARSDELLFLPSTRRTRLPSGAPRWLGVYYETTSAVRGGVCPVQQRQAVSSAMLRSMVWGVLFTPVTRAEELVRGIHLLARTSHVCECSVCIVLPVGAMLAP